MSRQATAPAILAEELPEPLSPGRDLCMIYPKHKIGQDAKIVKGFFSRRPRPLPVPIAGVSQDTLAKERSACRLRA